MKPLKWIVNALRGTSAERPRAGVLVGRGPEELFRDYPADGLTPQRLVSIFRAAEWRRAVALARPRVARA